MSLDTIQAPVPVYKALLSFVLWIPLLSTALLAGTQQHCLLCTEGTSTFTRGCWIGIAKTAVCKPLHDCMIHALGRNSSCSVAAGKARITGDLDSSVPFACGAGTVQQQPEKCWFPLSKLCWSRIKWWRWYDHLYIQSSGWAAGEFVAPQIANGAIWDGW